LVISHGSRPEGNIVATFEPHPLASAVATVTTETENNLRESVVIANTSLDRAVVREPREHSNSNRASVFLSRDDE
jgi:hypothetical protein